MLIPRKVAHRKQHRPHRTGAASGGTHVAFGEYGIQAIEHAYVTNRQIEAARIAMTRPIRRGGKGSPEWWIANVKPGRVMFELSYPNEQVAREALRRAIHKLPMKCRIVKREVGEA